jgi:tRNA 2-thiouridine synthesizing protein A
MAESVMELDLRGLRCPLPALRTEKELRSMQPGKRLRVVTDDPLAAIDIPHFCREAGHILLVTTEDGGARGFLIQCGEAPPASE